MAKDRKTNQFQFRVDDAWLHNLDHTIGDISTLEEGAPDRSTFVRDVLATEAALWRRSPYVCTGARHVALITSSGRLYYYRLEQLRVARDLRSVPAEFGLRRDLRTELLQRLKDRPDLRDIWALNWFGLWEGKGPDGKPLDIQSDHLGRVSKRVLLSCYVPEGSVLCRESCLVINRYALRNTEPPTTSLYDWIEVLTDVPCRNLDILVVLDRQLYRKFQQNGFQPRLSLELRNREGVPFSPETVENVLGTRYLHWMHSCQPGRGPHRPLEAKLAIWCQKSLELVQRRIEKITAEFGGQIAHAGAERHGDLHLPDEYLAGRLRSARSVPGTHYSVRWPKIRK